jgi:hypothetical protein
MTTPNQVVPAGAYEVGGSGWHYGQDFTEDIIRNLTRVPAPTLTTAIDLLREYLLMMPLEVLQTFKDLLPPIVTDSWDTVEGCVLAILNALTDSPLWMKAMDFQAFLDGLWKALTGLLEPGKTLAEVLSKLQDWMQGVLDPTEWQSFLDRVAGKTNATIDDVIAFLQGLDAGEAVQDLLNELFSSLGGVGEATAAGLGLLLSGITTQVDGAIDQAEAAAQKAQDVFNLLFQVFGGQGQGTIPELRTLIQQVISRSMFGQIDPARLQLVPLSTLGGPPVNLLEAPRFEGPVSIDGKGLWFYDTVAGRTTPGCVYTDLDGVTPRTLWSNEIFVTEGNILDMDIYSQRENLVGDHTKIGIDLVLFRGPDPTTDLVSVVPIKNSERAGANSTDWSENLAGAYTIGTGVSRVRLQLRIAPGPTGRVRFDDGTLTKRGTTIPQKFIEDLPDNLHDIAMYIGQGATSIIKPGEEFSIPSIKDVLGGLLSGITQANASIADLEAKLTQQVVPGTVVAKVNFDDYADGSGVPPVFTQISSVGSGGVQIKNGALDWVDSGNQLARRLYLYTPTTLATDAFETTLVIPRRCENLMFSGASYNFLIGASNDAGTEYCVCIVGYQNIRLGYAVGGTLNWFNAGKTWQTPSGSAVRYRGEIVNGKPEFRVYVNNQQIDTYRDEAGVTKLNSTHRKCGLGFQAADRVLGQATPGSISMFLMNDARAAGTLIEV